MGPVKTESWDDVIFPHGESDSFIAIVTIKPVTFNLLTGSQTSHLRIMTGWSMSVTLQTRISSSASIPHRSRAL